MAWWNVSDDTLLRSGARELLLLRPSLASSLGLGPCPLPLFVPMGAL